MARAPLVLVFLLLGTLAAMAVVNGSWVRLALHGAIAGCVVWLLGRAERSRQALLSLALRDALTEVGNFRALQERLEEEIARHERTKRPFAVIVLDLDDFKAVNEDFGHLAGDRLLRDAAAAMVITARRQDVVFRQGGDEFCIIAPESTADDAAALARRLEEALRSVEVGGRRQNASFGWAVCPEDGTRARELLARADAAQGHVKRARKRFMQSAPQRP